ncbi:MAG TPA: hypothetical protein VGC30_12985 [Dokdonella sp.]
MAIAADVAVVGAPFAEGHAYVYTRNTSTCTPSTCLWQNVQDLHPSGADLFGRAVAVDADTIVVGAPDTQVGTIAPGAAYVYQKSGTSWVQTQVLTAPDGADGDAFGNSVAISGDQIVVGAWLASVGTNAEQGAAYVFVHGSTGFSFQQKLTAADGGNSDQFGTSVAISGGQAIVGAQLASVGGQRTGAAYAFKRCTLICTSHPWSQAQKLVASDGVEAQYFGVSVGIDAATAIVGAWNAGGHGAAYVFSNSGTAWAQQQELFASDGGGNFGWSVAIAGTVAVIGAPSASLDDGAAYVFVSGTGGWSQQYELTASDAASGAFFGGAVAVSADSVLVGARYAENYGQAYFYAPSP